MAAVQGSRPQRGRAHHRSRAAVAVGLDAPWCWIETPVTRSPSSRARPKASRCSGTKPALDPLVHWGREALLPLTIGALECHRHPGQVVCVLVDPLALEFTAEKDRQTLRAHADMSGVRGWTDCIRPDDHLLGVLWCIVAAGKFHEHATTGLRIVRRAVSVVERDAEQAADMSKVVLSLIGEARSRDVEGVDFGDGLRPVQSAPLEFQSKKGEIEGQVVRNENRALEQATDVSGQLREDRLSCHILILEASDTGDLSWNWSLRVDEPVVGPNTRHPVVAVDGQLHRTEFDDPVTIKGVEPGGLRIESDDALCGPTHEVH